MPASSLHQSGLPQFENLQNLQSNQKSNPLPQNSMIPDESELLEMEKVGRSRTLATYGAILLLIGIFLLYPSWKFFFFMLFVLLIIQATPNYHRSVSILGGLPYGKKIAPVKVAPKPWWQTLLFSLTPDQRSLWTGLVATKPHMQTARHEFVGRVRFLLVGRSWHLQCSAAERHALAVDVRASLDSPQWRTWYTCPAIGASLTPPSTSMSKWLPAFTQTAKAAADNPLVIDWEGSAAEWYKKRLHAQNGGKAVLLPGHKKRN